MATARARGNSAEQRADDGAGACSEIENRQGVVPPRAQQLERQFDERLRVGARVEHAGRDAKIERPEAARSENARDGFARGAARREIREAARGGFVQRRLGREDEIRMSEAGRRQQQRARVAARLRDARPREVFRRPAPAPSRA